MLSEISFDQPNYRIYFGPSFNNENTENYEFIKDNSLYKYMTEPGRISGYTETIGLTHAYKDYLKDILSKPDELGNIYNACLSLFSVFYQTLMDPRKRLIDTNKKNISNNRINGMIKGFQEYIKKRIENIVKTKIDDIKLTKLVSSPGKKYNISKKEVLSYLYKLNKKNMYITCAYIYSVKSTTFGKDQTTFVKKINLNKLYILSKEFFTNNKIQKILENYHNILKLGLKKNTYSRDLLEKMKEKIIEESYYNDYFLIYSVILNYLTSINNKIIFGLNKDSNIKDIEDIKKFLNKINLLLKNLSHTYDTALVIQWVTTNIIKFDEEKTNQSNSVNLNNQLLTQTMNNIKKTGKFIYVSLSEEINMNNNLFNKLTNETGFVTNTQNLFFKCCVFYVMGRFINILLKSINTYGMSNDEDQIIKYLHHLSNKREREGNPDTELMKEINNYYVGQCYGSSYFYQYPSET
jgi:hypothetical protein